MTEYHLIKFNLSDGQKAKARSALKNHTPLSIRISASDMGHGDSHLSLTQRQAESLDKKHRAGMGATLSISHKALKHTETHGSGFFRDVGASAIRWGGNKLADYVKNGSGVRAKKVKGKGFFGNLAGGAVRGLGGLIGSALEGSGIKRTPKPKKKVGKGFFGNLAGGAVRGLGGLLGSALEGSGIKRKRKQHANGFLAPGY